MIFIDNKYTRWYFNIINAANTRTLQSAIYTERHHIIPKSLGGDNSKDNLVRLTAREHFICHLLLIKMTNAGHRVSMIYALHGMRRSSKKQNRYVSKNTSRVYEMVRKDISDIMKTRVISDETRQRMSISNKRNPSEETRRKMSESRRGRVGPMTGKTHSEESRRKMSETHLKRQEEIRDKL
jgi:hypothetical protein